MSDFTLEDLINMKLDDVEPKKKRSKKKVIEESSEEEVIVRKPKKTSTSCHMREVAIIFVLFVLLSSKLACGQADRVMRIQCESYSIYDLLVRGIVMTLLFFILCRLFK